MIVLTDEGILYTENELECIEFFEPYKVMQWKKVVLRVRGNGVPNLVVDIDGKAYQQNDDSTLSEVSIKDTTFCRSCVSMELLEKVTKMFSKKEDFAGLVYTLEKLMFGNESDIWLYEFESGESVLLEPEAFDISDELGYLIGYLNACMAREEMMDV